jgi:hypothetical protein
MVLPYAVYIYIIIIIISHLTPSIISNILCILHHLFYVGWNPSVANVLDGPVTITFTLETPHSELMGIAYFVANAKYVTYEVLFADSPITESINRKVSAKL